MIARLLRGVAVAIAVAAAIDPPVTTTARERPRVALIVQSPETDAARLVAARVAERGRTQFEVIWGADATADAAVVVGHEYPAEPVPDRQRVLTVTLAPSDREPNIRVIAVRAPRAVQQGTLIHIEIDVDGSNVAGSTSTLTVRTGSADVEVARAAHAWTASPERWRATVDVTPLESSPWRMHVSVSGAAGERLLTDNEADAMVSAEEPLRVLVYEPRLSWAGTFVRHALERDARFDVASLTYPSRVIAVTAGDPPSLRAASLDRTSAIVIGGLDRVTAEDAGVLASFMRDRGGAVVLLPDSRADAQTMARWLPVPTTTEVLLERAARLSVEAPLRPIEASELLTFAPSPEWRVLAKTGTSAAVVGVSPVGGGQLAVSGALDAWRFRANDDGAFDRFWQSAIAGLAAAAPPAVDVEVVPPVVAPGQQADVSVRIRRAALGMGAHEELHLAASLGAAGPVRLWPADAPDSFRGSFTAPAQAGAARLTVSTPGGAAGTANVIVAPHARTARPAGAPLALLAESHGGSNFASDDVAGIVGALRQGVSGRSIRTERRPMRSTWWLLPFAACLGGEWWLRRRRGLR